MKTSEFTDKKMTELCRSLSDGFSDRDDDSDSSFRFRPRRRVVSSHFQNRAGSSGEVNLISIIDRIMEEYSINLLRAVEGLSVRISQLETRTQKIEDSVCEIKDWSVFNHDKTQKKLKELESILTEVQVGIRDVRDKQDISEVQIQMAKLQILKSGSESPDQKTKVNAASSDQAMSSSSPVGLPQQPYPTDTNIHRTQPYQTDTNINQTQLYPTDTNIHRNQPYQTDTNINQTQPYPTDTNIHRTQPYQTDTNINQTQPYPTDTNIHQIPSYHNHPPPIPIPTPIPTQIPVPATQFPTEPQTLYPPYPFQTVLDPQPYYSTQQRPLPLTRTSYNPASPNHYSTGLSYPAPQTHYPNIEQGSFVASSNFGSRSSAEPNRDPSYGPKSPELPRALPMAYEIDSAESGSGGTQNTVPVTDVVDSVVAMGFRRDLVRATVKKLTENGQSVDLNVVLDKLMSSGEPKNESNVRFGR